MLVEVGFGALLVKALWSRRQNGKLTPERETAYLEALEACRGPDGAKILRKTADVYAKHGLPVQAKMLRARADYIDAPYEVKQKRAAIIDKARQSFNVVAIEGCANEFEKLTATGIAQELRERARKIKAGEIAPPLAPPSAPAATPAATPAAGTVAAAPPPAAKSEPSPIVTPPPMVPVIPIVPPAVEPEEPPPPAAATPAAPPTVGVSEAPRTRASRRAAAANVPVAPAVNGANGASSPVVTEAAVQ